MKKELGRTEKLFKAVMQTCFEKNEKILIFSNFIVPKCHQKEFKGFKKILGSTFKVVSLWNI